MRSGRGSALLLGVLVVGLGSWISPCLQAAETKSWRAGASAVDITPVQPMWMSGYAGRDRPAEGTLTKLWAKALVLEDPRGERVVMVTLDLVGIGREVSLPLRQSLKKEFGLEMRQIAFCTSHTHTGPVVGANLGSMYSYGPEQQKLVDAYTLKLHADVTRAVDLQPSELAWAVGHATFAVNRRENREADVPELREKGLLKGPIDHDVPVLQVKRGDKVRAIVFGYACHSTVLSFYQWSGDYPGFAQIDLQQAYPGAIAMFWAGCGADQNPLPRRTVELAQEYGSRLAKAVQKTLEGPLKPIEGQLDSAYSEIDVVFDTLPTKAQIEETLKTGNKYEQGRARHLLMTIEREGKLSPTYPYPIETWRLGNDLLMVVLGGEVVVDYSIRIKSELGPETTWVAGYSNDVMAYIPSVRVLKEGGYEGASSMIYYGQPTIWAESIEESIMQEVHRQAALLRKEATATSQTGK